MSAVPFTGRTMLALGLLAAWLGAAVLFAAVVAPAAFAVLPARSLAGAIVGRVLPVVLVAGIVAGVAAGALTVRGAGLFRWAGWAAFLAALACAIARFAVGPRIERLRAEMGPSIEALAADDARRVAFGRLHALSVGWLGLGMVAAVAAVVLLSLALRNRSA